MTPGLPVKVMLGRWLVARGMDKNHKYLEESWDEHEAYIDTTRQLIEPLLQKQLTTLAASVGTAGRRIVVYNPLAWRRSGIVTVRTDRTDLKVVRAVDGNDASYNGSWFNPEEATCRSGLPAEEAFCLSSRSSSITALM